MSIKILSSTAMFFFLTACQTDVSHTAPNGAPSENQVLEEPQSKTPPPSGTKILSSNPGPSNFIVFLVDGVNPNEYKVKLQWNWDKIDQSKFIITRKKMDDPSGFATDSIVLSPFTREFEDVGKLDNGAIYSYSIKVESRLGAIGEGEIRIPTDIVFKSGKNDLDKMIKPENDSFVLSAHRIFFEDNSELVSGGKNIEIYSDIVHFKRLLINTDNRCSLGNSQKSCNLKHGGLVRLVANQFKELSLANENTDIPLISVSAKGDVGGKGEKGKKGRNYSEYNNGKRDGENGGDGGIGGSGGSGGDIEIDIKNVTINKDILIHWNTLGGLGGPGGDPGEPGKCLQQIGQAGTQKCWYGKFGLPGNPGKNGMIGNPGKVCIKFPDIRIGCDTKTSDEGVQRVCLRASDLY